MDSLFNRRHGGLGLLHNLVQLFICFFLETTDRLSLEHPCLLFEFVVDPRLSHQPQDLLIVLLVQRRVHYLLLNFHQGFFGLLTHFLLNEGEDEMKRIWVVNVVDKNIEKFVVRDRGR